MVKSGVSNATDTAVGQVTQTANGFNVHFSDTLTYRTDVPDGSFLIGVAYEQDVTTGSNAVTTATGFIGEPRTPFSVDVRRSAVKMPALTYTTTNTAPASPGPALAGSCSRASRCTASTS